MPLLKAQRADVTEIASYEDIISKINGNTGDFFLLSKGKYICVSSRCMRSLRRFRVIRSRNPVLCFSKELCFSLVYSLLFFFFVVFLNCGLKRDISVKNYGDVTSENCRLLQ